MDVAYPVFDERWYRETYADVDQAVRLGVYASGHNHYARYGRAEGRFPCAAAEEDHRFGRGVYALTDAERQKRVSAVWSADAEQTPGWYWMAHPMVRTRLNVLASGDPATDAYGHFANLLRHRGVSLPIGRAVSLGCGFGGLERDLAARGIIAEIDAYDIAPGAIAEARRLAEEGGFTGLRYHVADLEHEPIEAGAVDVVFAHSSVHHVERLEALFASVNAMLKPGGMFHLYEYVGPTRFQWTDAQIDGINRFLERLPPRLRMLPSGHPRPLQTRPTIGTMIAVDPSEAIRSSDIIPLLGEYFDVLETRMLGGTLLHLGLADIAQNFDPDSPDDRAVLESFFAEEDAGLRDGTIASDFAVITVAKRDALNTLKETRLTMTPSFATQLSLLFPPAKRLHEAILHLNGAVAGLVAERDHVRAQHNRLAEAVQRLEAAQARPAPDAVTPAPAQAVGNEAELDRWTEREMQSASLRNLPFLPGDIRMDHDGLVLEGYAGAPEGLTANMAFFVNGHRFDQVEYPVLDPELASRFSQVTGMGYVVRAKITQHLDELRSAPFWRFDAAPTGHMVAADWRKAIHFKNPAFEKYPLPPVPNIKRVIGDTSPTRFAMGGAIIFKNVEHALGELGFGWADFPRVLDWGCGAGRVTRYMVGETQCEVTGADIDPDNIAWCKANYDRGRFAVVPLLPPTSFANGEFNLVTGLSVMTHLSETNQWLWLAELQRITSPGALLFISIQGPTQFAYNRFPARLYRQVLADGYLNLSRDGALDDVIADTEYYRAAMHSRAYVTQRWGQYFEILAIADAIAGLQDFVIMRRRG